MEEDKRGSAAANDQSENAASDAPHTVTEAQPGVGDEATADAAAELAAEVGRLKAENTELKDRSLRLMAEMENLRRRTERDKSEFSKYAISEFARDILSVGDNIQRAIGAVPKDVVAQDSVLRSFVEGVEVTERDLLNILEKYHIKRFDPQGEPFNPHLHEAMTKIDAPNVPADTVVQVIHVGYMIGERVLRPAAVIVAKGDQEGKSGKTDAQGGDYVPPGAMKIPETALQDEHDPTASRGRGAHSDVASNVLGRDFQSPRRRQGSSLTEETERVAPMRRPRSPAGDQSYGEVRSGSGPSGNKPSALHKPVIKRNES